MAKHRDFQDVVDDKWAEVAPNMVKDTNGKKEADDAFAHHVGLRRLAKGEQCDGCGKRTKNEDKFGMHFCRTGKGCIEKSNKFYDDQGVDFSAPVPLQKVIKPRLVPRERPDEVEVVQRRGAVRPAVSNENERTSDLVQRLLRAEKEKEEANQRAADLEAQLSGDMDEQDEAVFVEAAAEPAPTKKVAAAAPVGTRRNPKRNAKK